MEIALPNFIIALAKWALGLGIFFGAVGLGRSFYTLKAQGPQSLPQILLAHKTKLFILVILVVAFGFFLSMEPSYRPKTGLNPAEPESLMEMGKTPGPIEPEKKLDTNAMIQKSREENQAVKDSFQDMDKKE